MQLRLMVHELLVNTIYVAGNSFTWHWNLDIRIMNRHLRRIQTYYQNHHLSYVRLATSTKSQDFCSHFLIGKSFGESVQGGDKELGYTALAGIRLTVLFSISCSAWIKRH